ncbi:MAG: hypothetical protein ABI200_04710 [Gaiellales bacterium]
MATTTDALSWLLPTMTVVATLAVILAIVIGWRSWTALQRVRLTRNVALQLIDTHAERLQESFDLTSTYTASIADGGEELAEHVAELRADVDHLRWMVSQVPDGKQRLQRELLDTVLPTRDEKPTDRDTDRDRANA